MKTHIQDYNETVKMLKRDYPELSTYEALSLAVQIERNSLIENGLSVSRSDSHPSALEVIATALGAD